MAMFPSCSSGWHRASIGSRPRPRASQPGRFSTPQEVLENVFAKIPESFERFELHPELWVEAGDDVVVTGRVIARTKNGRELDAPYAHVFSFTDDKVSRNDNFHDTALWAAALG